MPGVRIEGVFNKLENGHFVIGDKLAAKNGL